MTSSWDIFTNMPREPRYIHVEFGDNPKYAIKLIENIEFLMDLGGILQVNEVF